MSDIIKARNAINENIVPLGESAATPISIYLYTIEYSLNGSNWPYSTSNSPEELVLGM